MEKKYFTPAEIRALSFQGSDIITSSNGSGVSEGENQFGDTPIEREEDFG